MLKRKVNSNDYSSDEENQLLSAKKANCEKFINGKLILHDIEPLPSETKQRTAPATQVVSDEVLSEESTFGISVKSEKNSKPQKTKNDVFSPQLSAIKSEMNYEITVDELKQNATQLIIKKKTNKFVKTEENFEPINRWWERSEAEIEQRSIQWNYLEHNGMLFSPPYEPHYVCIRLKGQKVSLPPAAEEVANFWCGVMESEYATKERFIDNFWKAFISKLPEEHPIIKSNAIFSDVDFFGIKNYLDDLKEKKKDMSKDEKEALKLQKEQEQAPYAFAIVDWIREKVGNSKVEPPGLFRGRGEHPKQGMLKRRIFAEDIILNLAEDAPVPKVSRDVPGHCWNDIYHDNTVTWLAFYRDSINDQVKYMYLSAQSKFKGQQDFLKYEKARKLKLYVDPIRSDYHQKMRSSDEVERQLGTATYLIDFLALRVGGEKDTEEEADTVGCCSLRNEHCTFNHETQEITLDFLGKDSIRYYNTVKLDSQAFKNMLSFTKGKKPDANVFSKISTASLNQYLKELMPGLSAKVFRTYNASITLQRELENLDTYLEKFKRQHEEKKMKNTTHSVNPLKSELDDALRTKQKDKNPMNVQVQAPLHALCCDISNVNELIQFYNDANRTVAILCNHQRSVPKQHEASMQRLQHQLNLINEDARECQEYLQFVKKLRKEKESKFKFNSNVMDLQGNPRKNVTKDGMKEDACQKKLHQITRKQKIVELKMKMKDENKTVALGTSKINYMDPRITVAFCKKYEIPIEKIFNKSLRLKFPWAMFAHSTFEF